MQWHFAQSDWHEQKANNGAQNSYQYTRVSGALSVSHLEIDTTDTCDHNSHQYTRVSGSLSMFHLETFFFPVMIFFSTLLCLLNSLIPKIVLSCRLYIFVCFEDICVKLRFDLLYYLFISGLLTSPVEYTAIVLKEHANKSEINKQ